MAEGGGAKGRCADRAWALKLLTLLWVLLWPIAGMAQALQVDRDFLLLGEATDQQAPVRACTPEILARLTHVIEVPPPVAGWSGAPQALDVFNVFAGEVMISHGERQVCGHMQDARTRDSRFRAGIGMVMVPSAGNTDPILVAWEPPLKARWIPTVRLGAPSPVQQSDTARLLVRTACIAIALALALSALMGYFTTRGRDFLTYTLVCALLVVWQSILSGLSGYPEPWLPVGRAAPMWMVAISALSYGVMIWMLWRLCGGRRVVRNSRRWMLWMAVVLGVVALLTPFMSWHMLAMTAVALDGVFALACMIALGVGFVSLRRGHYHVVDGMVAVVPLLLLMLADVSGNQLLVEYRVEAAQLSVTWFLMMSAYSLNRSLGHMRQQRDEMRQLADTDMLTGLPNRRAGLRQLEQYLLETRLNGQPLSIGFLDIDLFKQINDRYGHDVGDQVLVSVARTLESGVRNRSDVIRMGGEEFLILLPGNSADVALPRLEQLRERVSQQVGGLDHDGLTVTSSIGLAELGPDDNDVAALLRRADNAMYRAKRSGRNRVVDARDTPLAD
ncbi:diguanylate cyclase [Stenotrophomonas sp. Iso1]|uniref:GGDEF domain-containing protein n=1 Tax=Stenotrophomonas sp. Iso1 TaxID=2977283 RepID=UPI0022B7AA74|nr:diguanylate cyclase [Stenotrophomonas sp. Iso1]